MELLVTQLHDHNKVVSMEALDILDEACEDKVKIRLTKAMTPIILSNDYVLQKCRDSMNITVIDKDTESR